MAVSLPLCLFVVFVTPPQEMRRIQSNSQNAWPGHLADYWFIAISILLGSRTRSYPRVLRHAVKRGHFPPTKATSANLPPNHGMHKLKDPVEPCIQFQGQPTQYRTMRAFSQAKPPIALVCMEINQSTGIQFHGGTARLQLETWPLARIKFR